MPNTAGSDPDTPQPPEPQSEGDGLDSGRDGRLDEIDRRLKDALERRSAQEQAEQARLAQAQASRASGAAWRIMIDLVAAVAVCGALGYGAGLLFGGQALWLIAGLVFGFGIGMYMAARAAMQLQRDAQKPPGSDGARG
jgi:F0F1-type ATP synthase assembly protein I